MFKELRKPEKLKAAILKTQATVNFEKLKKFLNDQSFKSIPCNVLRMRRDQNDHAKTNSQNPEPEGSGRKHWKARLPMRLLGEFYQLTL